MAKRMNLIGQRFGKLVVREFWGIKHHETWWVCDCDCGNETVVAGWRLKNGDIRSCGCLIGESAKKRFTKHGGCSGGISKLYYIYAEMKQRCYNKNRRQYKWYGAKGIRVCDEWLNSYANFEEWALSHGYVEGLSIDRIDSEKDYMPDNCRWITMNENTDRVRDKTRIPVIVTNTNTGKVSRYQSIAQLGRECDDISVYMARKILNGDISEYNGITVERC